MALPAWLQVLVVLLWTLGGLTASRAEASERWCVSLLVDRMLGREVHDAALEAPLTLEPLSKRVQLVFEAKPDHTYPVPRQARARYYYSNLSSKVQAMTEARVLDMSKKGYVFVGSRYRAGKLTLEFVRDARLLSRHELPQAPLFVEAQRAALQRTFPRGHMLRRMSASREERYYSERPDDRLLLSAKTLAQIPDGRYAFVVLSGENFLRLGSGHPILGARELAIAAGDIEIVNQQILFLSPRSDTYRPAEDTLVTAVNALWEQGLYPQHLQLREWNNRTLLFDYTGSP